MSAARTGRPLRGAVIALALPALALTLLSALSGQPASAPRPALEVTPLPCPAQVAQDLGLGYTVEDGVTENLDQFHADLIFCEMTRGQWICWDEENEYLPTSLEGICGTPTQLNEALASGTRIWWIDLSSPIRGAGCQEDMPCWDCRTMGNLICGGTGRISASSARPLALTG